MNACDPVYENKANLSQWKGNIVEHNIYLLLSTFCAGLSIKIILPYIYGLQDFFWHIIHVLHILTSGESIITNT